MSKTERKIKEIIGNLRLIWKEPLLFISIIVIF
jgi:iron(III) transport system permease protein